MTYQEFDMKFPFEAFGQVNVRRGCKYVSDEECQDAGFWRVYLDHSCDEWVIGWDASSEERAREMAENLLLAADFIKANP